MEEKNVDYTGEEVKEIQIDQAFADEQAKKKKIAKPRLLQIILKYSLMLVWMNLRECRHIFDGSIILFEHPLPVSQGRLFHVLISGPARMLLT